MPSTRQSFDHLVSALSPAIMSGLGAVGQTVRHGASATGQQFGKVTMSAREQAADQLQHMMRKGGPLEHLARSIRPQRRGPGLLTLGLAGAATVALGYFLFVDKPKKAAPANDTKPTDTDGADSHDSANYDAAKSGSATPGDMGAYSPLAGTSNAGTTTPGSASTGSSTSGASISGTSTQGTNRYGSIKPDGAAA